MLLKRIYDHSSGQPKLDHIEVRHTGWTSNQNFSVRLVERAVAEGWMTLGKGLLILHAHPEDLTYRIVRGPGYYCCHCGESIADAGQLVEGGTVGLQHARACGGGFPSPDPQNPSGYCRLLSYACLLDETLHRKYSVPQPSRARRIWNAVTGA